jgi:hypothetical protein
MDIKDLKATAYDLAVTIDGLQRRLAMVNQQINNEINKANEKKDKPEKNNLDEQK